MYISNYIDIYIYVVVVGNSYAPHKSHVKSAWGTASWTGETQALTPERRAKAAAWRVDLC